MRNKNVLLLSTLLALFVFSACKVVARVESTVVPSPSVMVSSLSSTATHQLFKTSVPLSTSTPPPLPTATSTPIPTVTIANSPEPQVWHIWFRGFSCEDEPNCQPPVLHSKYYSIFSDGSNFKELPISSSLPSPTPPANNPPIGPYGISPDGSQQVYVGAEMGLHIIDIESGRNTALYERDASYRALGPACWLPDGTAIWFIRSGWAGEIPVVYRVYPDGKGLEQLFTLPGLERFDNVESTCSPDGREMALTISSGTMDQVGLYILENSGATRQLVSKYGVEEAGIIYQGTRLSYPAVQACLDAPRSQLEIGMNAFVSTDPPLSNRLRNGPGTEGKVIGEAVAGTKLQIIEGPQCANSVVWWKVQVLETGLTGWTVEGDTQSYWLIPCLWEQECQSP